MSVNSDPIIAAIQENHRLEFIDLWPSEGGKDPRRLNGSTEQRLHQSKIPHPNYPDWIRQCIYETVDINWYRPERIAIDKVIASKNEDLKRGWVLGMDKVIDAMAEDAQTLFLANRMYKLLRIVLQGTDWAILYESRYGVMSRTQLVEAVKQLMEEEGVPEIEQFEMQQDEEYPVLVVKKQSLLSNTISTFSHFIDRMKEDEELCEQVANHKKRWETAEADFNVIKEWLENPVGKAKDKNFLSTTKFFGRAALVKSKDGEEQKAVEKSLLDTLRCPHMRYFCWKGKSVPHFLQPLRPLPPLGRLCLSKHSIHKDHSTSFRFDDPNQLYLRNTAHEVLDKSDFLAGVPERQAESYTIWLKYPMLWTEPRLPTLMRNLLTLGRSNQESWEGPSLWFFIAYNLKSVDNICSEIREMLDYSTIPDEDHNTLIDGVRQQLEDYINSG